MRKPEYPEKTTDLPQVYKMLNYVTYNEESTKAVLIFKYIKKIYVTRFMIKKIFRITMKLTMSIILKLSFK
jgi:hypothetical protein